MNKGRRQSKQETKFLQREYFAERDMKGRKTGRDYVIETWMVDGKKTLFGKFLN